MAEKKPSDQLDKFLLRLPDGMRDDLKEAAKANGRTMNAEVVARLAAHGNLLAERARFQILATHNQANIEEQKRIIFDLESKIAELSASRDQMIRNYEFGKKINWELDRFIHEEVIQGPAAKMLLRAFSDHLASFVKDVYEATREEMIEAKFEEYIEAMQSENENVSSQENSPKTNEPEEG